MDDLLSLTDEQLVLLIQEGDTEKYGILMARYYTKLSRYGRKFLHEKENIEDIVQDVFISTFQNINNFNTALKFSSWIYRIAHNAFVNGLKRQQRSSVLGLDLDTFVSHTIYEDSAEEAEDHDMMKKMIDQGLEKLTSKCREVIILHYLEGLSYKEISDILRIPTGTVAVRVLRGKDSLRKIYKKTNMHYE